ncbi:8-oxo-dGTP diphosphatase [Metabacillus arenae]|uniref:8-oxo-dGTP diphosphatase n=1 Tax=Metabacillus arenae TaxID=2771434 RepID=A0A926S1Z3_9BACI|nr:8-oxo-dGTP diphosphatase [Metabacillus arenae]MBD1381469.1 8-oxo-dGTP diphosphatase [Metabacillus arenae]
MQRVTNCLLIKDDQALLLQKPRRGWWVAPGGKMEQGETIKESVIREYREETGIYLKNPEIKGVFTILIRDEDKIISEWMMFTFFASEFTGENVNESEEGKLKWHNKEDIQSLPMAPGDYHILDYMLKGSGLIYGTFVYTPEFELLSYRLDPQ